MAAVIIPHINARIDILDKGEGTYSGQGTTGDIPHGHGSWKAHAGCWFTGEWDHGVPVRGVYYDDGWVDFGEFAPDLSRKGWAAAFIPDPSSGGVGGLPFGGPPGFQRPPSPLKGSDDDVPDWTAETDPSTQQAMAALGLSDPSVFPGSRRSAAAAPARAAAAAPSKAASAKVKRAVQPPVNIEGQWNGTKCITGNIHHGLVGKPQRMPEDVAQKVTQLVRQLRLHCAAYATPADLERCCCRRPSAFQESSLPARLPGLPRSPSCGSKRCPGSRTRRSHFCSLREFGNSPDTRRNRSEKEAARR